MKTTHLHETLRNDFKYVFEKYKDSQIKIIFNRMENGKYLIHYDVKSSDADEWTGVLEKEGVIKISRTNRLYCEGYIQSLIDFGYTNISIEYI